ncbi:MAG: pyruvate dehydrogenase (acetyl-transferring) E1 component subunit alpha, partial [Chloroflexaceae bacterium]
MVKVKEAAPSGLEHENVEDLKHYYYQMLLIRRFEERTSEMYVKAKIGGYCHLNL